MSYLYLSCLLVGQVSEAKDRCDMARDDAELANERAEFAKNQSVTIHSELQSLILIISEFLEQLGARPEDIRMVGLTTTRLQQQAVLSTTQLLEILEISWSLKLLREIWEVSWNSVDAAGKFYNSQCDFSTSGDF